MSSPLTPAFLFEGFAREMAVAVAALLGESTTVTPAAIPSTAASWHARITASGALTGEFEVALSDHDGRRISALIMGFDPAEVGDDAVLDTLRELCGQAVGALKENPETSAVALAIADVAAGPPAGAPREAWQFPLTSDAVPVVVVSGELAAGAPGPAPVPVARPTAVVGAPTPSVSSPAPQAGNLDLLLDIELPLTVRFGQTELTLLHLTRLGPGSVIDLHRSADEPVEVLVSGKVIARGEVVVVEGNYGVRVTEVVSTADRIRSLGA
jgi:flagellar motor switch protein FliN/FliY